MLCSSFGYSQVSVQNLLCENSISPVGIDVTQPRFSWQLVSDKRNVMQTAYEIRVGTTIASLQKGENLFWSSGKVSSLSDRQPAYRTDRAGAQSVQVEYSGNELSSRQRYYWQVRVWDNYGNVSEWSEPAFWQMGLLHPSDWKAQWIKVGYKEDTALRQCPMFRKEFETNKKIESATAYITSHGMYEAYINGAKASLWEKTEIM
jgi:alpha-L-rhamnosidase